MTGGNAKSYVVKLKAGVIVRQGSQVLLIRERNNRIHQYRWNIIKGTFEPGKDSNIIETAIREAKEEANARIKVKYFLSTYYLLDGNNAIMMFTFIADLISQIDVLTRNQGVESNNENITRVKFFSRQELSSLKPEDFVGMRGYLAIQDYLEGKKFPLSTMVALLSK